MKFLVDAQLPARLARYLNDTVVGALDEADFVELGSETMVVHRRRGEPTS